MRLTFLGTCSGTAPMPGRRHVSFVVEQSGGVYWFDAGEGCSYTAHLAGIDILSVRALFITHTHLDHTGGLANLIWTMRKLDGSAKGAGRSLSGKNIKVLIPNLSVWEGVLKVAAGVRSRLDVDFNLDAQRYQDGVIYDDGVLRVIALHNEHLGRPEEGEDWQSYSFRIETARRSVVYSGDVADIAELDPILEGCDLLLMETGHHEVADVCAYFKDSGRGVGRLAFLHHGRGILRDPLGEAKKARDILGEEVIIADDGMALDL